jgi:serine protease inhibitor
MKINETKLKKIIQEEMDMIDQPYFDHVDSEGGMAKSQLYKMAKYAMMLHDALEDDTQLEAWVQSKITMASEYISKVKHYLEYEMNMDMIDPEGHDEPEVGGCGSDAPMIVDDTESFEIDDEMMHLMET